MIKPIGWSGGAPVYGDGKATSARKQIEAAMRKRGNNLTGPSGLRIWKDRDGKWRIGNSYYLADTYPSRKKAVEVFVRKTGPRQSQETAPRAGIETRPKGSIPKTKSNPAKKKSNPTRNGKKWAKGAVTHGGKLGGAGYLKRPAADRRALLTRAVGDDGYRSAMSSLTFLLNVGKTTLTKTEKGKLQADKIWLKENWGNPSSTGPKRPGKPKPKTPKAARKLAGDFSLTIERIQRGPTPSVETVEKGKFTGATVTSDFPLRNLVPRLTRGLGFCPSVAKKAFAAVKEGKKVTLTHMGGRGQCVPAAKQAITISTPRKKR